MGQKDTRLLAKMYLEKAGGDVDAALQMVQRDFAGGAAPQLAAGLVEGGTTLLEWLTGPLQHLLGPERMGILGQGEPISEELSPARFNFPGPSGPVESMAREAGRDFGVAGPVTALLGPGGTAALPLLGMEAGVSGAVGALQAEAEQTPGVSPTAALGAGAAIGLLTPGPEDASKAPRLQELGFAMEARTGLVSKYAPLKAAERRILGETPELDMAARFEQLAQAPSQAVGDVLQYEALVLDPIKRFLPEIEESLAAGRPVSLSRYSPQDQELILQSLDAADRVVQEALTREVYAGRISPEDFQSLVTPKQRLDRLNELTGGDEKGLKALAHTLVNSRIQSESNLRFRQLAELAEKDTEGEFFRLAGGTRRTVRPRNPTPPPAQPGLPGVPVSPPPARRQDLPGDFQKQGSLFFPKTPKDFKSVDILVDGTPFRLQIRKDIAGAILGQPNATRRTLAGRVLGYGLGLFRFGAVTANLPFQVLNLKLDTGRLGTMSRMGVGSDPLDLLGRFGTDWLRGLYHSARGNAGFPTELYIEALQAGTLGGTMSRALTMKADTFTPRLLREGRSLPGRVVDYGVNFLPKVSNFVEEIPKLTGMIRGKRFFQLRTREDTDRLATEILRYAGSPHFLRTGSLSQKQTLESIYLLIPFINAKIQDVSADLGRLGALFSPGMAPGGRKASAAAYARLTGLATAMAALHYMNTSEREVILEGPDGPIATSNAREYGKLKQWEMDGYFNFPLGTYFKTADGRLIRDYFRISKRGVIGSVGALVEQSLRMLEDQDPKSFAEFGIGILEDLSPINVKGENLAERAQSFISNLNPIIRAGEAFAPGGGFNSFTHRHLQPLYLPENPIAPSRQASSVVAREHPEMVFKSYTPPVYVQSAEFINSITGAGMTPLQLEHLFETALGGLPRIFRSSDKEEGRRSAFHVPGGRRFFRSSSIEPSAQRQRASVAESDFAALKVQQSRALLKIWEEQMQGKPLQQNIAFIQQVASSNPESALGLIKVLKKATFSGDDFIRTLKGFPKELQAAFYASEAAGIRTGDVTPEEFMHLGNIYLRELVMDPSGADQELLDMMTTALSQVLEGNQ